MPRTPLIARQGCWYDGAPRTPGERFLARTDDATVLVLLQKAAYADPIAAPRPARRSYRRKDLQAEDA